MRALRFLSVVGAAIFVMTLAQPASAVPNCPPGTHVVPAKGNMPGGSCEEDPPRVAAVGSGTPDAGPITPSISPSAALAASASAMPVKSATPAASAVPADASANGALRPTTGGCHLGMGAGSALTSGSTSGSSTRRASWVLVLAVGGIAALRRRRSTPRAAAVREP